MLWTRLNVVAAIASLAGAGLIVCSYGLAAGLEAPPAARNEDARQILARMAETYAVARSYEDEGEVVTLFINNNGRRHTDKKPFSTKFVRPRLFRYEFSKRAGEGEDERDRYVIWSEAGPTRARCWWTLEPEIEEDTLASSLGTAAGVSGRSSNTVPALLMPGLSPGSPFTRLREIKLVGTEAVDGTPCDKIEGKSSAGNPETVWIDKATYLVKKILRKSQVPGSAVESTTTYRPRLNVEIAPGLFRFVPPPLPQVARQAQPAAPAVSTRAAASSETERRLAEVERKVERILRVLEGENRARPAPETPVNPNSPQSPDPPRPPVPPGAAPPVQ